MEEEHECLVHRAKKDVLCKLDAIDKHYEIFRLTTEDRIEQMELRAPLDRLLEQEQTKWKQGAKVDELLEGAPPT